MGRITVGGLGPADHALVTAGLLHSLDAHDVVRLRTGRHPAAAGLDLPTYDAVYDNATTFDEVYRRIVDDLVSLSADDDVLYVVPGAPNVAERTVELLLADETLDIELLPAMSFLDLTWSRLRLDPVQAGVTLADALQLDALESLSGAVLFSQCHSSEVLNDLRLAFAVREPTEAVVLHHLGLADEVVRTVPWGEIDSCVDADHLTSVYVAAMPRTVATAATEFADLVGRLRRECPWDAEQTHQSLVPHLIEEAFEAVEAIEATPMDDEAVAAELGDVLFQVVLHSVLAEEVGAYDLVDVIDGITDKLVRRHPHVFGDDEARAAGISDSAWEQSKLAESGARSVVDQVPALPALALAAKLVDKSRSVGFRWPDSSLSRAKIDEELDEFDAEIDADGREREFGDVLLASVAHARDVGIDPDAALRRSLRVFRARVRHLEIGAADDGVALDGLEVDELLARWAVAKRAVERDADHEAADS